LVKILSVYIMTLFHIGLNNRFRKWIDKADEEQLIRALLYYRSAYQEAIDLLHKAEIKDMDNCLMREEEEEEEESDELVFEEMMPNLIPADLNERIPDQTPNING